LEYRQKGTLKLTQKKKTIIKQHFPLLVGQAQYVPRMVHDILNLAEMQNQIAAAVVAVKVETCIKPNALANPVLVC